MPRMVGDAGGELSARYVSKLIRYGPGHRGELTLGGRPVRWEWTPSGVAVSHPAADPGAGPVAYLIPTVATVLPSGGGLRR